MQCQVLQYFTTPKGKHSETLVPTVGPRVDITSRFMTAQGVLIKVSLWDTGGSSSGFGDR